MEETPQEDGNESSFTWKWAEGLIIVLCFITLLVNITAFSTLKMYRVCSSAVLITLMTLILGIRVVTEALKLVDDESRLLQDFIFHIRVTHDISKLLFGCVIVILFFQWYQTYRLLKNPQDAAKIMVSNTETFI